MDIVWFLLAGATAGWVAGKITRGSGFGVLGNLLVGLLGSAVGGVVFPIMGIGATSFLGRMLMATGGAIILVFVIGVVVRPKKPS